MTTKPPKMKFPKTRGSRQMEISELLGCIYGSHDVYKFVESLSDGLGWSISRVVIGQESVGYLFGEDDDE